MQDMIIGALAIIGTCLVIALATVAIYVFRPGARRRRRKRRHSRRPRIDLFAQAPERPAEPDA